MAPSNPKRPPRPPRPPGASASKKEDVELPFDDDEVAPLQEDDPRPQRVPQFPAGPRRSTRGPRGAREGTKDRELSTRFDTNEYSDPGHVPVFLYVEKGPGTGQLIPVKQGPLVIGRASACDLRLQHPSISRRHAQLMRQGDRFLLRDLGSQNGTFVNRMKLTTDTEIGIGDELSLGNAVLRLRGHGTITSDNVPQVQPPARKPVRKGMSLSRVALVAVAVGSAVAALLAVAFLKFSGSGEPPPDSTQSPPPPTDTPAQKAEEAYVPPPPASPEEGQAAAAPEEEAPRALKPIPPPEDTPGPKASGPRASASGAKGSTPRKESGARSSAKGSADTAEKAPANIAPTEILALYEKGDVPAALNLARGGPLEAQITRYQAAVAAAQKALSGRDTNGAIQQLSTALAVDQELSQGWSDQGRKLRKQLGRLYTQAGQAQVKAGAKDAARESFEMALKYDPTNTWAKTELQQLRTAP